MGKAGLLGPDTTCCTSRDVNFAIIEGARANGMETKVGTLTAASVIMLRTGDRITGFAQFALLE